MIKEQTHKAPRILSDQTVRMSNTKSANLYPTVPRRYRPVGGLDERSTCSEPCGSMGQQVAQNGL